MTNVCRGKIVNIMEFNDLLLLLRQLRDEKVNGKLDEDEFSDESKLWRNRLDYHIIEMSIKGSYDEVYIKYCFIILYTYTDVYI